MFFRLNIMVSIITINYNGYNDTCELIDSLYKNETVDFEVIVIDNASKDNEAVKLAERYPQIKAIRSEVNLGFAGGNNLGYDNASGDYILFMNNDMIVTGPFIEPLIRRFESSDSIGLLSPKIKYYYAPDTIQYAGFTGFSKFALRTHLIGEKCKDDGNFDNADVTASTHGACMFTSRGLMDKVGKMTDIYFLFYEEHDWSMRFREAGYQIWYESKSCVYHKESMTIKRGTPSRLYYLSRARAIFTRRNTRGFNKFVSCAYLLSFSLPKQILEFSLKGQWPMAKSVFKGFYDGFQLKIKR